MAKKTNRQIIFEISEREWQVFKKVMLGVDKAEGDILYCISYYDPRVEDHVELILCQDGYSNMNIWAGYCKPFINIDEIALTEGILDNEYAIDVQEDSWEIVNGWFSMEDWSEFLEIRNKWQREYEGV